MVNFNITFSAPILIHTISIDIHSHISSHFITLSTCMVKQTAKKKKISYMLQ